MRIATISFRISIYILLLFGHSMLLAANAPMDSIEIPQNLTYININKQLSVFFTDENLDGTQAYDQISKGKMSISEELVSPGFSLDYYWILFSIKNPDHLPIVLELDNPHIDFVEFYSIAGNHAIFLGAAGDRVPFDTRQIVNRRMIFKLSSDSSTTYLLKIDKRFASISFPLRIWSASHFEKTEKRSDIIFGIYFGGLLFIAFISVLLGIGLPDRLFLSYALYVFLVSLYIFTQLGFSYQFLYPTLSEINSDIRVILASLNTVVALAFFSKLLHVNRYIPWLYKVYQATIVFMFSLILMWFFVKRVYVQYYLFTIPLLNILYIILFLFFISIIFIAIKTWSLQRRNIFIFTLAYSSIMTGVLLYVSVEYGLLPESLFPINPIMIGSIIEILILCVAMIYRIKQINDDKNELLREMATQQKELMQAYVRGGENERSRVSAELHDNIGSNLSLLRRKIETGKSSGNELKNDIDLLCEDVRDLSHRMIPHTMNVIGLSKTLQSYCNKFQNDTGIIVNMDSYDFPNITNELSLHLFRLVQEALHNVEKHAHASEVDIQLIGYEKEIVVTIDDDGEGFDTATEAKKGLGLETMKSRVNAFNGKFEIASYIGKGTNILVKIPVDPMIEPAS
jgi:signal transduction histidine kinase